MTLRALCSLAHETGLRIEHTAMTNVAYPTGIAPITNWVGALAGQFGVDV